MLTPKGYGRTRSPVSRALASATNATARQVKRDGPAAAFLNGRPVEGATPRGKVTIDADAVGRREEDRLDAAENRGR